MKEYAKEFYNSDAWDACRKTYAQSVGKLCERCMKRGLFTPGVIVHHKIRLTPENITDPNVALNWKNLELLCIECHNKEHAPTKRRYFWSGDKIEPPRSDKKITKPATGG